MSIQHDVRKVEGKAVLSNQGPSEQGWLNRLKEWVGKGKALLTHFNFAEGQWIGDDGASTGARHSEKSRSRRFHSGKKHFGKYGRRPTRKEAPLSTGSPQSPPQQSPAQPPLRVHIRWMIRRDMAEVLDIERESFEFPWYEEDFIRCLRQRNCIGMVAEHGERVVGFMIYELHKSRLHILNFAVAHPFRQRDVGRQMAEKLISKLSSQRRTQITLEVRETNLPAQMFFKQLGFRATSVLRSYYEDSPEDAYLMQFCHRVEEVEATIPISGSRIDRMAG